MHSVQAPGYSDFFTSGIRLISRRAALQNPDKSTTSATPIPLSFDGVLSDSDSENDPPKSSSRRSSMFIPFPKTSFAPPSSASVQSHISRTSKPRKHQRSTSLISHIFGGRNARKLNANRVISNDESGWLSSASSVASLDDNSNIDFMDLSNWPECPNVSREYESRLVTELDSEPETLDPFSSSPSSKSFFVDVDVRANSSSFQRDTAIPIRRRRPLSTGNWSNRLSFSSISSSTSSSSLFSSPRRSSAVPSSFLTLGSSSRANSPAPDASFLHITRVRPSKRSSVERKRPASIHVMTTSEPIPLVTSTNTTTFTPIKAERRYTQTDMSTTSRPALFRTLSHARSRSAPLPQPQTRSRVRSLFLSKTSSIAAATIPETDLTDNDENEANDSTDRNTILSLSSLSNPEFQVPGDRVSKNHDGYESMSLGGLLMVEDEEAPASASDAREFFEDVMDADAPKRMDWRQFCIEILDGQSDAW